MPSQTASRCQQQMGASLEESNSHSTSLSLATLPLPPVRLASAKKAGREVGDGKARKQPIVPASLAFQPRASCQAFTSPGRF